MARKKKIDKEMGLRLKQARTEQKLTYEELAEKSGVSSRYIKEIENHGNVPADNLDYQRLLVYLSQCTEEQITTILAIVEAYLRTYKNFSK